MSVILLSFLCVNSATTTTSTGNTTTATTTTIFTSSVTLTANNSQDEHTVDNMSSPSLSTGTNVHASVGVGAQKLCGQLHNI